MAPGKYLEQNISSVSSYSHSLREILKSSPVGDSLPKETGSFSLGNSKNANLIHLQTMPRGEKQLPYF